MNRFVPQMKLYRHINEVEKSMKGCVVALGNFDGFHRGHRVVIGEAGRLAKQMNVPLALVVTEPHPVSFFAPDRPPFRLTPFRERIQLLEHFGVDFLVILPFDKELASMTAQDFVTDILIQGLDAKHIFVGYDYRFGKMRGGGNNVLSYMGEMEGFGHTVIKPVVAGIEGYAGEICSSTLVRKALLAGEARKAAALLGHWWSINGKIIKGDQRGRTIGFPTANIELGESQQPLMGVYAVRVLLENDSQVYEGVANIGQRPTFDKRDVLLEVHLFDFDGDIYNKHARVELVSFIREEKKFNGLEELKDQIERDCRVARVVLATTENDRDHLHLPTLEEYLVRFPEGFTSLYQI
ncbi:bifunctional riboflavin kinase/FAD synthetase [Temperatibacter marinus]|uniref:Riboflavin biosynthesis protein n=1 Tax=Temperatibacter marinus TaxID=1456591 RepID=A0AA52EFQ9_9PROT|nr:bifunctional riboflavin kinase/FAD synthetase [Temperatibacter marinus]WND02863.1 bifunctional riboflavin kinase/FAD synthetase [Temperatibacter marinus]